MRQHAIAYADKQRLVLFTSVQQFQPPPNTQRLDGWKRVSCHYRGDQALPHIAPLYCDRDCDGGLEEALNLARYVTDFLVSDLEVATSHVEVFFSGSKGAHVLVDPAALGIEPSATLTRDMKTVVMALCRRLAAEAGAPRVAVDDKVYSMPRMLREENQFNPRSGLYKVRLTLAELRRMSTPEIQALAKAPRAPLAMSDGAPISAKACAWWQDELGKARQPREFRKRAAAVSGVKLRLDGFAEDKLLSADAPDCIQSILESSPPSGQRNRCELQVACWGRAASLPEAKAVRLLARWVERNRPELSPDNARSRAAGIVRAAYAGGYGFSCSACRGALHGIGKEAACVGCQAVATGKRQMVSAVRAGETDIVIPRITLERARERTREHARIAC